MTAALEIRSNPRHRHWTKMALIFSGALFVSLFFGLLAAGLIFRGEITRFSFFSLAAPAIGIVNLLGGLWLLIPQRLKMDDSEIESTHLPFHRCIPWTAVQRLVIAGLDDDSAAAYGVSFESSVGHIDVGTDFSRGDLRRLSQRTKAVAAERGIRVVEVEDVAQLLDT